MLAPSHILHISHPAVTSAYIKQDLQNESNGKQILVLETVVTEEEDKFFDLLVDLQDIKRSAEKQFGDISRVDIRGYTCH